MNIILVIVIVLLFFLIYIKNNENNENFTSFNKLKQDTGLDNTEFLDQVKSFAENPKMNIVAKELDDKLITNFIKRQLGEKDAPPKNSLKETGTILEFAEEPIKEVSEKDSIEEIDKVKKNYEHLIDMKTHEQKIKLNNIFYELKKINDLESELKCEE